MSSIDAQLRARIIKVLALLSSDHAGERDAAAIAARKLVELHGITWQDLLEPQSPRERIDELLSVDLTWAEKRLLKSAAKQLDHIEHIVAEIGGAP